MSEDTVSVENRILSPQGRYARLEEKLGSGAYKDVWRAYDTNEGIEVAWNVIKLSRVPQSERKRIKTEVKLLKDLVHPNVIKYHNSWVNREKEEIILITEIMSAGSLKDYIKKNPMIRWNAVKRWCRQILKGLEFLHGRQIIHRDIKCDNIFINGSTGDLRIGDLGLSTKISESNVAPPNGIVDRETRQITAAAMTCLGTPEFMAPELYDENYNEKVDIYAFGMACVEMVTALTPYHDCTSAAQIYKKVLHGDLPPELSLVQLQSARSFIESCLQGESSRPSATQLLSHNFLCPNEADDFLEVRVRLDTLVEKSGEGGGRTGGLPDNDSYNYEDEDEDEHEGNRNTASRKIVRSKSAPDPLSGSNRVGSVESIGGGGEEGGNAGTPEEASVKTEDGVRAHRVKLETTNTPIEGIGGIISANDDLREKDRERGGGGVLSSAVSPSPQSPVKKPVTENSNEHHPTSPIIIAQSAIAPSIRTDPVIGTPHHSSVSASSQIDSTGDIEAYESPADRLSGDGSVDRGHSQVDKRGSKEFKRPANRVMRVFSQGVPSDEAGYSPVQNHSAGTSPPSSLSMDMAGSPLRLLPELLSSSLSPSVLPQTHYTSSAFIGVVDIGDKSVEDDTCLIFRLRVPFENTYKEIEFEYDLVKDDPRGIVEEMNEVEELIFLGQYADQIVESITPVIDVAKRAASEKAYLSKQRSISGEGESLCSDGQQLSAMVISKCLAVDDPSLAALSNLAEERTRAKPTSTLPPTNLQPAGRGNREVKNIVLGTPSLMSPPAPAPITTTGSVPPPTALSPACPVTESPSIAASANVVLPKGEPPSVSIATSSPSSAAPLAQNLPTTSTQPPIDPVPLPSPALLPAPPPSSSSVTLPAPTQRPSVGRAASAATISSSSGSVEGNFASSNGGSRPPLNDQVQRAASESTLPNRHEAAFPSPSSSSTAAAVTSRLPSEATHALSGQAGAQAVVGEISVDGQEEDLDDTLETDEEYLALVAKYNETVNKIEKEYNLTKSKLVQQKEKAHEQYKREHERLSHRKQDLDHQLTAMEDKFKERMRGFVERRMELCNDHLNKYHKGGVAVGGGGGSLS